MIPHIRQAEGQIGFCWVTPDGRTVSLPDLVAVDAEPARLAPTHLAALDDAMIVTAAAALAATRARIPPLVTTDIQKFGGYSEIP